MRVGIIISLSLISGQSLGGIDGPGVMTFDFLAVESYEIQSFTDLGPDAPFDPVEAEAWFSSDASSFGDSGVFVWAGFDLEDPEGLRYAMLLMDLDLGQASSDDEEPLPHRAIRAEYLEKRGDQVLFSGVVTAGDVWLVDLYYLDGDRGAVEGAFELIFADPDNQDAGSRVFNGRFVTRPSPSRLRLETIDYQRALPEEGEEDPEVQDQGCGGDEVVASCGGYVISGCVSLIALDCEGDDGDGALEGHTEGDTWEEASMVPRGAPLTCLLAYLPWIGVGMFVRFMRRRK
jgi:hypothetical protein